MSTLLTYAALGCVAAGLVTAALTLFATRNWRLALRTALDFWLAAGLLRLSGLQGWEPLLVAMLIVAVRQLTGVGLRHPAAKSHEPVRALGEGHPDAGRTA